VKDAPITKVCRFAWDYPTGGASTFGLQPVFVNLSEEQVRQGYEVHVIARKNKSEPAEEENKGVHIHRMDTPFTVTAAKMMRSLFHEDNGGWVVHTHSTCGFFLFPTKSFRDFPMVCHVHGTSRSHHVPIRYKNGNVTYDYQPLSVTYNMMRERLLWSSGDRVLTVSNAIRDDVVDYYGLNPDRVDVVYNGTDVSIFKPGAPDSIPEAIKQLEGKTIILFVGHFGLRKGLFHLLRAMPKIKEEIPTAHLLCIGGVPKWLGPQDHWALLRSQVKALDIENDVTLMDAVKNAQLPGYYTSAKLLALPSYYESFSKVTVEAMACGLPVVASKAGGLVEVVDDGKTGILVDYGAVRELEGAIVRLLQNPSEAVSMGRLGREKVQRMFTWQSVANRIRNTYESLAGQDAKTPISPR
jgi:glycosyltransferase involved in cell wall biosynthesis